MKLHHDRQGQHLSNVSLPGQGHHHEPAQRSEPDSVRGHCRGLGISLPRPIEEVKKESRGF